MRQFWLHGGIEPFVEQFAAHTLARTSSANWVAIAAMGAVFAGIGSANCVTMSSKWL